MAEEKTETKEEKTETKEEKTETKEEKTVEVPKKFKEFVSQVEEMTVLELSELVKVLEDKFGVSSVAPMMVAGAVAAEGDVGDGDDSGGVVNIELTDGGGNKISVIKALREVLDGIGLKDAKDLVDSAPKIVKEGVEKAEAEEIKKKLEEAGAKVEFK